MCRGSSLDDIIEGVRESEYVSYLKKRFIAEHPAGVFYKIPDSFGVDGKTRPYDYYTLLNGGFTAVEAKIHNSLKPFYFNKVESHQVLNLRKVHDNGGKAYLTIGIRSRTNKKFREEHNYDYVWFKANIWIPASVLPGHGYQIDRKALVVDRLFDIRKIEGSVVNEIYLLEEDFNRVTR